MIGREGTQSVAEEQAAPVAAVSQPEPRRRRWLRLLQLAIVLGFIGLLVYLHVVVVRVAYVPSDSMYPTLQPGDRLLVRKDAYRARPPQRGDVVVFLNEGDYQVKRVIAVAGDTAVIWAGQVFLNGQRLQEPYIAEPMILEWPLGPYEVPEGQIFVMGDNRNRSEDSRDFGPIALETLMGRATHVLLPLDRAGPITSSGPEPAS